MFWTSFGLTVGAMVLGTVVTYLPPERTVVYYGGSPYYCYNGTYYQPTAGGYVVVNAPPVVVQQPAPVVVQQPAPQTIVVQQPAPQTVVVQQPTVSAQVAGPAQQTATSVQQAAPQQQVQAQPQQQVQQQVQAAPQTYTEPPAYPPAQYQTPKSDTGTYDVYIPAGNGTFTLVQLKRSGGGYTGPQGEYYPAYPTMDQLKARYVK